MSKRIAALGICVGVMLVFTACFGQRGGSDGPDNPAQPTGVDITDPAELDALWNDYIYFCIANLQQDFSAPDDISLWDMVSYATEQFYAHGDPGSLEKVDGAMARYSRYQTMLVWPYEDVAAYIKQYFNYEITDYALFDRMEPLNYYGPYPGEGYGGLLLPFDAASRYEGVRTQAENPWGEYIEKALKTKDGAVEVQLSSNFTGTDLVCTRRHYYLSPREGGGYYFVALKYEHINQGMAKFSGTYREIPLDFMDEFNFSNAKVVGQSGDSFYFYYDGTGYTGDNDRRTAQIRRVNMNTGEITARLDWELTVDINNGVYPGVRAFEDGFLLKGKDNVYLVNKDLAITKTVPVPRLLQDKMAAVYDSAMNRNTSFFAGYEVSTDFSAWYYSNQEGLFRYDTATGTSTLLVAPKYGTGRLMEGAVIVPHNLCLMENDTKLTYLTYGYESLDGCYCLDLATGRVDEMPVAYYGGISGYSEASGHAAVNNDSGQPHVLYYDYATGETKSADLPAIEGYLAGTDYLSYNQIVATGQSHSAFGLYIYRQINEKGDNAYHLYRLRHSDMTVEEVNFSVDINFAQIETLAVTADGKILVRYWVNNAEQGFLLVG